MLTPALRKKLLTTANYTVLILMALVALFPIYFMVIASSRIRRTCFVTAFKWSLNLTT